MSNKLGNGQTEGVISKLKLLDSDSGGYEVENGCCNAVCKKAFPTGYKQELKASLTIAWALVVTQVCEQYFQPIAVMFGGHLGKLELDVIALSNTLINVLGNSIVIGMVSCCETAFSQCYGYGNYRMVGIYLQRGLYIHGLALLICYAIHLNIEPILLAIGQDPEVSRLTGDYMLYFMPGIFFLFLNAIIRRYTQCQSSVIPHIFIMVSGHVVHAILQYTFLYQLNLGILGSALAQDCTFFYLCVCTIIYTLFSKGHKLCWGGWDWRGLLEWGPLAKLGIFGLLMTCFEWWAFEISIILSGYIGTTELAAQSVAFNLDSLSYGIPFGLGMASGIRVGQCLGANEPEKAKTASRVGMTLTLMNAVIWAILYTTARFELPKLFTSDPEVIALVAKIAPILALYSIGSAVNTLGRGIFRGIGWQLAGSVLSFVCFYVVAWPIAAPLTFLTSLSILGMWWGLLVAIVLCGALYTYIILFRLNWDKLAKQAILRANDDETSDNSGNDDSDERTPLLRASVSLSQSIKAAAIKEAKDPNQEEQITTWLIVKRISVVAFIFGIFFAGLITRLMTQRGGDATLHPSTDDPTNTTTPAAFGNFTNGLNNTSTIGYGYTPTTDWYNSNNLIQTGYTSMADLMYTNASFGY